VTDPLAPINDLDAFVATRTSWHTLAEHVLAKALWLAEGHIGLRAVDGGVATPKFGEGERALVAGSAIAHEAHDTEVGRAPITTVRAAGELVGVEPGAPTSVYTPTTPLALDAPLPIDPTAAATLGAWFAFGDVVLEQWRATIAADAPSTVQLWPEHFDVGCDDGEGSRATYGASAGDAAIPEPYLYVSVWDAPRIDRADGFWNQSFGAALPYAQLVAAPDPSAAAMAFFAHGRLRLVGA
jgi:hypothetical protein